MIYRILIYMKYLKFALPLAIWLILAIVQSQSFSQTESRDFFVPAQSVSKPGRLSQASSAKLTHDPQNQQGQVRVDMIQLRKARLQKLFDAIRLVESGGNNSAIGDGGKALGPYQITRSYWQDAIRKGNVDWDFGTLVWEPKCSEQIMLWYWQLHCPEALDYFFLTGNAEILTRIHNGGPTGLRKPQTLKYWHRVQAMMK